MRPVSGNGIGGAIDGKAGPSMMSRAGAGPTSPSCAIRPSTRSSRPAGRPGNWCFSSPASRNLSPARPATTGNGGTGSPSVSPTGAAPASPARRNGGLIPFTASDLFVPASTGCGRGWVIEATICSLPSGRRLGFVPGGNDADAGPLSPLVQAIGSPRPRRFPRTPALRVRRPLQPVSSVNPGAATVAGSAGYRSPSREIRPVPTHAYLPRRPARMRQLTAFRGAPGGACRSKAGAGARTGASPEGFHAYQARKWR